jgi:hypothetical protein
MLLFLLLGGAIVDRLPRIHLMLSSDLLRGIIAGLIAFLAFQQHLELWQIFIMSALFGIVKAFFYPAYTAIVFVIKGAISASVIALGLLHPAIRHVD